MGSSISAAYNYIVPDTSDSDYLIIANAVIIPKSEFKYAIVQNTDSVSYIKIHKQDGTCQPIKCLFSWHAGQIMNQIHKDITAYRKRKEEELLQMQNKDEFIVLPNHIIPSAPVLNPVLNPRSPSPLNAIEGEPGL